jgi:hypothetical protein
LLDLNLLVFYLIILFFERFAETAAALAHSSAVGGALSEKSAALDSVQLAAAQTAARLAAAGAQMRRGDEQREVRAGVRVGGCAV